MVIPYLTLSLERSSYVHQALGLLGSEAALQVLFDELRSSDWRRVAAAAQGLGIARNPRANEHLYAAGRAATVGEAAIAIDAAIRRCGGQFPYPLTSAAGGSTGSVCDVNDASFDAEILNSTLPALVDFWAPWCGPCRAIAPVVEELARDYAGRVKVAKMNVDENTGTTSRYGLRAIPTIIIFKGGQVVEQITGAVPKTTIEGALKKFI
ncbi:MAG: thioredoxin [Deltaproteobacteria bacterium]|nr:thioredoxin [Deltaproteobacteria bacterium]